MSEVVRYLIFRTKMRLLVFLDASSRVIESLVGRDLKRFRVGDHCRSLFVGRRLVEKMV